MLLCVVINYNYADKLTKKTHVTFSNPCNIIKLALQLRR